MIRGMQRGLRVVLGLALALFVMTSTALAQGGEPGGGGGGGGGGAPPPQTAGPCGAITMPTFSPNVTYSLNMVQTVNAQITSCSSQLQNLTIQYTSLLGTCMAFFSPPPTVGVTLKPGESRGVSFTFNLPRCQGPYKIQGALLAANSTTLGSAITFFEVVSFTGCCRQ